MYSVRKTRSLSICLLMVLSAMGPIAVPAAADHEEEGPFVELAIWDDNNSDWEVIDSYMFSGIEAGDYEMEVQSGNLEIGTNYTMRYGVYNTVESDDFGSWNWNATSNSSSEKRLMPLSRNTSIMSAISSQWSTLDTPVANT